MLLVLLEVYSAAVSTAVVFVHGAAVRTWCFSDLVLDVLSKVSINRNENIEVRIERVLLSIPIASCRVFLCCHRTKASMYHILVSYRLVFTVVFSGSYRLDCIIIIFGIVSIGFLHYRYRIDFIIIIIGAVSISFLYYGYRTD